LSVSGMHDTLQPYLITATVQQQQKMVLDPNTVVEKSMFMENQFPYPEVRRVLYSRLKVSNSILAAC